MSALSQDTLDDPIPNLPGLDLIVGPMYSSKTTDLLRRLFVSSAVGFKSLYINHTLDNRNQDAEYSTHNPLYKQKMEAENGVVMRSLSQLDQLSDAELHEFQIIGIDEGQFFPDLKKGVLRMVEVLGKHVIVSGLNGDSNRQPFGQILDLIPYADHISKLSSYCQRCAQPPNKRLIKAIFTYRIRPEIKAEVSGASTASGASTTSGSSTTSGASTAPSASTPSSNSEKATTPDFQSQILIGAQERFLPVCRQCYQSLTNIK